MQLFAEATATEIVLAQLEHCPDPRLRQVLASVITHLHAVAREVEPTHGEWLAAIEFLMATGKISDGNRQEFVLLSDTLGLSMLVDSINNRKGNGGTESTVLGPWYAASSPVRDFGDTIAEIDGGEPCFVSGCVMAPDGQPIPGAVLDVWQADQRGFYAVQQAELPTGHLRGIFNADARGRYAFRSIVPSSYPVPTDGPAGRLLLAQGRSHWRPAHIHFILSAPGYQTLTTHLFVRGDPYLASDAVFGVRESHSG